MKKNYIEIEIIDDKDIISDWVKNTIDNPLELFSDWNFDDENLIYDESYHEETHNGIIENFEIKEIFRYIYDNYLRNNITKYNQYLGAVRLDLTLFLPIQDDQFILYEDSQIVGSFSPRTHVTINQ